MTSPVAEQNRAYRRGLVLGLTMAEIAILIIFCLLLASAFLIKQKEDNIKLLTLQKNELIAQKDELTQVQQVIDRIHARGVDPEKFDELFQELKRAQDQAAKTQEVQAELDKLREETKEMIADAAYAKEIRESLKNTPLYEKSAAAIAEALNSSGDMAKIAAEKKDAEVENERLEGQLANAQKTLAKYGKGGELPSCWADPATGKTEYIFSIQLTSTGLIIHDRQLLNRVEEQARLPLSGIAFDRKIGQAQFLTQTKPLWQWGQDHNCRFVVIANDRTAGNEKAIYKAMLRTLEDRFYKFQPYSE